MTSAPAGFALVRRPLELRFRILTLASRDWIAPDYVRVRLTGSDLAGFNSLGADDHMRLFFMDEPAVSVDEVRAAPGRESSPGARTGSRSSLPCTATTASPLPGRRRLRSERR